MNRGSDPRIASVVINEPLMLGFKFPIPAARRSKNHLALREQGRIRLMEVIDKLG